MAKDLKFPRDPQKLRIIYYQWKHIGHFPHMFPYYKKLGGLVFVLGKNVLDHFKREYPGIPVTDDLDELRKFRPNIIMYADYHTMFETKNIKHVMVFHAMENKGYFAIKRDWNKCEKFDLCLLYGNKILQEFKDNGWNPKYKIIGYPRFDYIQIMDAKRLFNNDRKTILIAPTWSTLSLLHRYTNKIMKLSEKYNVIVKPHTMTVTLNDNNVKNIRKLVAATSETLKIFGNPDILPLMNISDMMITDISGCSCEFMYFDKPLIIANAGILPKDIDKNPDIWKVFKVCNKPVDLIKIVDSQFENDEMRDVRNEYARNLVHTEKGSTATERGVKAMEELFNE